LRAGLFFQAGAEFEKIATEGVGGRAGVGDAAGFDHDGARERHGLDLGGAGHEARGDFALFHFLEFLGGQVAALAQEGLGIVAEGHFDHGLVDGLQAGDFPRDLVGKFVEGNALENFAVERAEFAVEAERAGAFGAEGGDQAAGDDSFEVADRSEGRAGAEGGFEFGGEDRVRLERNHGAAQLEKGIRRGLVDEGEFVEAGEGFFKALEDFFLERFGLGGISVVRRQEVHQTVARAAEPIGAGGRRAGVQMLQEQLHLGSAIGKAALQIPLEHGPGRGIEGVLPLRRVIAHAQFGVVFFNQLGTVHRPSCLDFFSRKSNAIVSSPILLRRTARSFSKSSPPGFPAGSNTPLTLSSSVFFHSVTCVGWTS
jgi:hypothetical protein